MKEKEYYKAAVYLRLSRDDAAVGGGVGAVMGGRAESNSISSQREMICSFIRKQGNMEIYDIYVDDGWSGTSFDRPGFKRMMEDIRAGYVDCVIVKDLSRLGRDYIEAGRLIQKTFPAFSVRFIALTDHFDSLTADYNETSLVVPVKNFVNDSYARDISGKVRSHQKVKRENGAFIGAFAVYGYRKSRKNKNSLVPDEYAAHIVRKIFAWKIEGYSSHRIAEKLNDMGILSPMEYKRLQGEKFQTGFAAGTGAKWSAVAVKRILEDENYTGTLVQGKEEKVSYKVGRSVKKPKEEWVRVQNAHEAVISKADFEMAGRMLQTDTRAGKGEEKAHIYAGILYCGDCREAMIRRVNRYKEKESLFFICAARNRGEGCTRHLFAEKDLNRLALEELRLQLSLFMDKEKVLSAMGQGEAGDESVDVFGWEIEKLRREREKYISFKERLYEDFKKGILSEEDFRDFGRIYEQRQEELGRALQSQEKAMADYELSRQAARETAERMKGEMQLTELDRAALVSFVKRILIYEDKRVCLELRYREPVFGRRALSQYAGGGQPDREEDSPGLGRK